MAEPKSEDEFKKGGFAVRDFPPALPVVPQHDGIAEGAACYVCLGEKSALVKPENLRVAFELSDEK